MIVDVAIDQGGCCETSKPTTHHDPIYVEEKVLHYCVANMPGAVPRTSTWALTSATLTYVALIADWGVEKSVRESPELRAGVNIWDGIICNRAVAKAQGREWVQNIF